MTGEIREGEETLPFDPGARADASMAFIGRLRTPWTPEDCPKNIRQARERGGAGHIELAPGYAAGLTGLAVGQWIVVLVWAEGRRDLILQSPAHTDGPRGTFALRSPRRPNPILSSTVRITEIDTARARIGIDATDAFDGSAVLDIKPWIETVDMPPDRLTG
jgi:tRNA (Thr-GGU) A37 N-methylase